MLPNNGGKAEYFIVYRYFVNSCKKVYSSCGPILLNVDNPLVLKFQDCKWAFMAQYWYSFFDLLRLVVAYITFHWKSYSFWDAALLWMLLISFSFVTWFTNFNFCSIFSNYCMETPKLQCDPFITYDFCKLLHNHCLLIYLWLKDWVS